MKGEIVKVYQVIVIMLAMVLLLSVPAMACATVDSFDVSYDPTSGYIGGSVAFRDPMVPASQFPRVYYGYTSGSPYESESYEHSRSNAYYVLADRAWIIGGSVAGHVPPFLLWVRAYPSDYSYQDDYAYVFPGSSDGGGGGGSVSVVGTVPVSVVGTVPVSTSATMSVEGTVPVTFDGMTARDQQVLLGLLAFLGGVGTVAILTR